MKETIGKDNTRLACKLDGEPHLCQIKRSRRKTVALTVEPDGVVSIRAPYSATHHELLRLVDQRSEWLLRAILRQKQKVFVGATPAKVGDDFYFLGKRMAVEIDSTGGTEVAIHACSGRAILPFCEGHEHRRAQRVEKWYSEQAHHHFSVSLDEMLKHSLFRNVDRPELCLRRMKSQWGNCRMRSGRITLNTHLIKLPVNCIELVVAHELCHFLSSGHGKSFYQYLETVCPEWRFVAARLNGYQLRGSKT